MSNWKLLVGCYIVTFGLWGFFVKVISKKLDWRTIMFYVLITIAVFYGVFIFRNIKLGWSKFHILAIVAGVCAAIGTMAFYKALSLAPASRVIPLSAQYILVTVLLCTVFLKEPLSLKTMLGIMCSITAIILLSQ
ncbi:MAG: EamA family transporter [Candidatus Omnitrophota bacterium]|nr:MAG: EamA family transporter [Candidatus Omnitrophota bacterium]